MILSGGTTTLGVYDFKAGLDEFGKVDYWSAVSGGHPLNKRVMLSNGEIVQSTIPANTNNPNTDMTGWAFVGDSIKKSVSDMLAISSPKNGQIVKTLSYINGKDIGGNTYKYVSSRSAKNDGGYVINGWVVQNKTVLTVWDFGYEVGNAAGSTTAIQKAFASVFPLKLQAETLSEHNWTEASNTLGKVIIGEGTNLSIVDDLKFVFSGSVLISKNWRNFNQAGNLNYSTIVSAYDYVEIDNYESENSYDGVSIWGARTEKSKAIVKNSTFIKAARIGLCSDLGAKNVLFENNKSIDCRQGLHIEDTANYTIIGHENIRCGSGSPTPATNQPAIYAGGYRFHKTTNGLIENIKNTSPAGTSKDWLGGGCTGFYAKYLDNVNFVTDDVANLDHESSFTYRNLSFKQCKNFSIVNQLSKSIFSGEIIFEDISGGNIDILSGLNYLSKKNQITLLYMDKINSGRVQANTAITTSSLYLGVVISSSQYFNLFDGFALIHADHLTYNWLTGDESQYPDLGFRFIGTNAKSFYLGSFVSLLRGGGSQISLESVNTSIFKGGYIGKIVEANGAINAFLGLNYDGLNITAVSRLSSKGDTTTTASLNSASNDINAKGKYLGRTVLDTSASPNRIYVATGSGATSRWLRMDDNNLFIDPV